MTSASGRTKNMSSLGVLFVTNAQVGLGDPIEFLVTLPPQGESLIGVRLRCLGKVVRLVPETDNGHHLGVAATVERYEFQRP